MSTTDSNGIVFLEETDIISPFHTMMNTLQSGTSGALKAARRGPLYAENTAARDAKLTEYGSSASNPLWVDVNGELQRHNGTSWAVVNGPQVHAEYVGVSQTVGTGVLWGLGTLTRDAAASVGPASAITTPAASALTVTSAGIYAVSLFVAFTSGFGNGRGLVQVSTGGTTLGANSFVDEGQGTLSIPNLRMTAGQRIDFHVFQGTGTARTLGAPRIRMTLLRSL